jgi:hypothetical protein
MTMARAAWFSQDVAVRGDDGGVEVAAVDVDGQHRVLSQVIQRCCGGGCGLPARVDVPAVASGVTADVVADSAGGRLSGDFVPAIREPDRADSR